jgi:hypothetical protein
VLIEGTFGIWFKPYDGWREGRTAAESSAGSRTDRME